MKRATNKPGFTILELALAMAFISFLLLAIGVVTIQISRFYQKGVTIKMVNSNGRELVDEFSRTILASKYDKVEDGEGEHFEYTYTGQALGEVDGIDSDVPLFGAFCTGSYSYIWNTGYALRLPDTDEGNSKKATILVAGSGGVNTTVYAPGSFRLLRINDAGREICLSFAKNNAGSDRKSYKNEFVLDAAPTNPVELLSASEGELVLYDLVVHEPTYHTGTGNALFDISFALGTMSGDVDITTTGDYCRPSSDAFNAGQTYCSINKFNFATRATGGIMI